jgi:hypothetical protein
MMKEKESEIDGRRGGEVTLTDCDRCDLNWGISSGSGFGPGRGSGMVVVRAGGGWTGRDCRG